MKGYLRISPVLAGVMVATGTVGAAGAQCVMTQDCKALGYTEASCSGGKGVKCPFGNGWVCCPSSKEVCQSEGFKQACTGTGQIGSGESCAGLYKKCMCQSTYQYSCTGTGYAGGAGSACGGKYTQCTCSEGYEWKSGSCQKQAQNGAVGDLYYCNGAVVAVKAPGMNFYVAMQDLGRMTWSSGNSACQNYSFCGNLKGTLPTLDQLKTIYNNKSSLNSLFSTNGGTKLTENWYWSSTPYGYGGYHYYIVDMSGGTVSNHHHSGNLDYGRPVLASY